MRKRLRERLSNAAEAALAEEQVVSVVEVLVRIGWLKESKVAAWRQGRVEYLIDAISTSPENLRQALQFLIDWAEARKLDSTDVEYLSQSLDPKPLRFTPPDSGPELEAALRARWLSPNLSDKQRERLEAKQAKAPEIAVVEPLNEDWTCGRCGREGGRLLVMDDATRGPICLSCAGLSELVFLPAGDTKLTRRARAESSRSFVVIRFNRRRHRYERQGTLVEEDALKRAQRAVES